MSTKQLIGFLVWLAFATLIIAVVQMYYPQIIVLTQEVVKAGQESPYEALRSLLLKTQNAVFGVSILWGALLVMDAGTAGGRWMEALRDNALACGIVVGCLLISLALIIIT